MNDFHLRTILRLFVALLILFGLTACQEDPDSEETRQLASLREELLVLEQRIQEEQTELRALEKHREHTQSEVRIIEMLRGGFRAQLVWSQSRPELVGQLRNDSDVPISRVVVEVTRNEGIILVGKERLTIVFDPILLPDAKDSYTVEASPFVWGFQKTTEARIYRFLVVEATLPHGKVLVDDFSATQAHEAAIRNQQQRITKLRLDHGAIYTRLERLGK